MKHQTGCFQGRSPVIRERAAHGLAVAPNRYRFGIITIGHAPLTVPHTPHIFLEQGARLPIRRRDGLGGFLQVMVVTQLVGDIRHDVADRQTDRGLAIRDHGLDRHGQRRVHLTQEVGQIGFAGTGEATGT